jgi:phosphotriesterase-related protein
VAQPRHDPGLAAVVDLRPVAGPPGPLLLSPEPPDRVILGHLNRNPDLPVQLEAAASGAFLAFDGPSRANHATDWRLFSSLAALTERGHAGQLLLGGDTTTAAARPATDGGPGLPYLLRVLRPRIERDLGPGVAEQIFVRNPRLVFAADWT